MFERRLYHHLDWFLFAAMLILCCIGVAMIYSTTGLTNPRLATSLHALYRVARMYIVLQLRTQVAFPAD